MNWILSWLWFLQRTARLQDQDFSQLSLLQCDIDLVLNGFFSIFANSPLSEVWWQHHNFCINCWSSEFPYDWKLFSHARHCLPVCNPSKQMEVELAGRDSSCAFKLPQRQRALHKCKVNCSGSSTRPSNEQACKAAYCSACFCRMLQRDAEMRLLLWGHK